MVLRHSQVTEGLLASELFCLLHELVRSLLSQIGGCVGGLRDHHKSNQHNLGPKTFFFASVFF
jgi:hypothetical protein